MSLGCWATRSVVSCVSNPLIRPPARLIAYCRHAFPAALRSSSRAFRFAAAHRHGHRRACASSPAAAAPAAHVPVLLNQVLHYLASKDVQVYLDCTLGAAGHAAAVAAQHPELRCLMGIDADTTALALAQQRLKGLTAAGVHLLHGNYSDVGKLLSAVPGGPWDGQVDAIVMDLGVSSMQLDNRERGFSFAADGPLDMRMNRDSSLTAEEVVNNWSEADIGAIVRDYGEEKMWRMVARRIVHAREAGPLTTTAQLVHAIGDTRIRQQQRSRSGSSIHPATRTFQALRIAVNDELGGLQKALPQVIQKLAPGGRLLVISFHSLEDRIVKRELLTAAGRNQQPQEIGFGWTPQPAPHQPPPQGTILTKKPVTASEEELARNPRSRSAKLRVFEKLFVS